MLATKIREILRQHPHWGPTRVAEAINENAKFKTSARSVTVTASREKIRFMDRRALEDFTDGLLALADA